MTFTKQIKKFEDEIQSLKSIKDLIEYSKENDIQVYNTDTVEILKADLRLSLYIKLDAGSALKQNALTVLNTLKGNQND